MASLDEFSREQVILSALRTTGRVAVNDLAARFGVSSVTVRKDLDALERRSLLRRVRGGAVSLGASDEGSFEARFTDSRDRKQAIAKAAAAAVRDGDVIAIDSSTTAFYLAQETRGAARPGRRHQRPAARDAAHGAVVGAGAGARWGAAPVGRVAGRPDRRRPVQPRPDREGVLRPRRPLGRARADGHLGRGGPDQARHGRRLRRGARPVRLDEDHRVRPAPVRRGGPGHRALDRRRGARRRSSPTGGSGGSRCTPRRSDIAPPTSSRSTPHRG